MGEEESLMMMRLKRRKIVVEEEKEENLRMTRLMRRRTAVDVAVAEDAEDVNLKVTKPKRKKIGIEEDLGGEEQEVDVILVEDVIVEDVTDVKLESGEGEGECLKMRPHEVEVVNTKRAHALEVNKQMIRLNEFNLVVCMLHSDTTNYVKL